MTDPLAADVAALDAALADLDRRERDLRVAIEHVHTQRRDLTHRRAEVQARIAEQAAARDRLPQPDAAPVAYVLDAPATATPAPAAPTTWVRPDPPPQPAAPAPTPHQVTPLPPPGRIRETSTRSVQNTLLALGGLLLGVAAIAFTAVAWTRFGDGGRAAILVLTSAVALTVPVLLARRGLTATAETIASVGLLLVLLDGYAAWSVGLFGVDETLPAAGYAAAVFAVTGVTAAVYQAFTRLAAPGFAALVAAQPVAPLVAVAADTGVAGWALAFAGAAAASLASTLAARAADGRAATTVVRVLGLVLATTALVLSVVLAVVGLVTAGTAVAALRAGGALLVAVVLGLAVGWASRHRHALVVAGVAVPLAVVGALSRTVALAAPGFGVLAAAVAVGLVWLAVAVLPPRIRRAPAIGCWIAAGVVSAGVGVAVLVGVHAMVAAGVPLWRADLADWGAVAAAAQPWGWQPTAVVVLLTVAAGTLLPRAVRVPAATAGVGLAVVAAPAGAADLLAHAGTQLPWWVPPLVGTVGAVAFGLSALAGRDVRSTVSRATTGAGLAIYAAATSVPEALASALVVGALLAVCGILTRAGAHAGHWYGRRVAAGAAGAGYTMLPALAAAVAVAAGTSGIASLRIALAVGALTLLAAALAPHGRRLRPGRPLPALTVGANLGAVAVAVIGLASIDLDAASGISAGVVLFAGMYVVISHATTVGEGDEAISGGARAQEIHQAAAVAVLAAIGTLSAVGIWLVPTVGLLLWPAILVTAAALACWAMPRSWRRGPVSGAAVAGGLTLLVANPMAVYNAGLTVAASLPVWHAAGGPAAALPADGVTGWRLPLALTLLAIAAAAAPTHTGGRRMAATGDRWRGTTAAVCGGLAAFAAPVGWGLPRWTAPAIAVAAAFGLGVLAVRSRRGGTGYPAALVAAVLAVYAAAASLSRPVLTGATLAAVALAAAGVAVLGRSGGTAAGNHRARIGGAAVMTGLVAGVGAAASLTVAVPLPTAVAVQVMTAATSLTLAVAAVLRLARSRYVAFAVAGVALSAAITWFTQVWTVQQPAGVYAAVVGLVGVGAGLLLLPGRFHAFAGVLGAAGLPLLGAVVTVLPAVAALAQPVQWVSAVWSTTPTTTRNGLAPGWNWYADGWDGATLVLLTVAVGLATFGLAGPWWVPTAVLPGCALALLVAPVALNSPWPALPVLALALAATTGVGAALLSRTGGDPPVRWVARQSATVCLAAGGVALTNSLATAPMTIVALGVAVLTAVAAAVVGRSVAARATGWAVTGVAAAALVFAVGRAADLADSRSAFGVLAVAVVMLAVAVVLPARRTAERRTAGTLSYLAAAFAVALAASDAALTATALVVAGYGVALGLSALPPSRRTATTRLVLTAAACELVASWLLLRAADVGVIEAYTVPLALLALLGGALELRRRPALRSWLAYGPALLAGFAPSLVLVFTGAGDGSPLRRLALGATALGVLVAGAVRRRQAPVVGGGGVLVAVALHELVVLFTLLPTWLPLAAGGVLLVVLGATYEKRRRDLTRLRVALRGMR